jgi:hypothetical protein
LKTRIPSVFLAVIVCVGAGKVHGTNVADLAGALSKPPAVSAAAISSPLTPASEAINLKTTDAPGVSPNVLKLALSAVTCAVRSGTISAPPTLTLIDYSLPSAQPRLWVFDLGSGDLLFEELVAHGRNTGENLAKYFSNAPESRQSSLGLFVADQPYVGSNGYSLRLDGLESGINDRARERAIVMHGAPYVDAAFAANHGRIGRSWGCPALRPAIARQVIDRIRGGGVIFAYYPDADWLQGSRFLTGCGGSALATN